MSASTTVLRIVSRELVDFAGDEDDIDDVAPHRTRSSSWSPKTTGGGYETIKPDMSSPMEAKSTRHIAVEVPSAYPSYLARVFLAGGAIFIVGVILLSSGLLLSLSYVKYVSWIVLTIGSAAMALSLLRAQDLDPR
jgi:hypothetical protein